jgi:hypothetical protein
MSMRNQFETLVRDLDKESLEQLRQSVSSEIDGRGKEKVMQLEDIHARMTAEDKAQALREIARVLEGRD